jgi:hypothetical protein
MRLTLAMFLAQIRWHREMIALADEQTRLVGDGGSAGIGDGGSGF